MNKYNFLGYIRCYNKCFFLFETNINTDYRLTFRDRKKKSRIL